MAVNHPQPYNILPMDNVSLEHLNEAVDLLSSTTAVAVFYTLVLVLYCFSFRLSYAQLRDDHGKIKRQTAYTLVLTTVLLICATLDVIVSNRIAQTIYIDDSTLLDGPQTPLAEHSVVALLQLDGVMNILEELLILGVLVSLRCVFAYIRNRLAKLLLSHGASGSSGAEPASLYPLLLCLYSSIS
jgi:hypothetical protein